MKIMYFKTDPWYHYTIVQLVIYLIKLHDILNHK